MSSSAIRIPEGLLSVANLEEVGRGGPGLYRLFKVNDHPQLDPSTLTRFPRTILVALIDTNPEAMQEYKALASELKVPYGTNAEVIAMGESLSCGFCIMN
jgi:hypothetical protein